MAAILSRSQCVNDPPIQQDGDPERQNAPNKENIYKSKGGGGVGFVGGCEEWGGGGANAP